MKIQQILETTTAGSVASVSQPMMKQTREGVEVSGLSPVKQVTKGKVKKKGPYANSISEGKVKQLTMDLSELTDEEFKKKYGKTKAEVKASMKTEVNEQEIAEQDLIVMPGGKRLKTGFIPHDPDRAEHEGQTLKNSLHTIIRVATHLNDRLSTQDNFPEWVSEKIGAVKSNMVTVMDYLISSQEMQQGVAEGRMTHGPGGVPLDRQGNPKVARPAMPKLSRMAEPEPEPELNLDKIWFDVTNIIGNIFPDGDPADYLPKYCRKHGCTYDDIRAAARKHGYDDEYAYIDELKTGDYGYNEGVTEGFRWLKKPWMSVVVRGPASTHGLDTAALMKLPMQQRAERYGYHGGPLFAFANRKDANYFILKFGGEVVKDFQQGVTEGVTSPEIKQAYDAIMQTEPRSPERRAAIAKYQKLRALALKKKGVAEGSLEEVSDKTLINYLTKVDADSRKHKMDPTKRDPKKASKSVTGFSKAFNKLDSRKEQGVAESSMPYPHGKPEAGDKITWYLSNHYPEIEGEVIGWKDGHLIVKSIDPSSINTEKTVVKYRVPKNNILSVQKQGVAEGSIGDKIKGAAKSVKRATQGWGVGAAPDMITPTGVVSAFKNMDGQRLATFVAARKDFSKPRKDSASAFADKVIDREMKQRGYGRVADKDEQGVAEGAPEQKTFRVIYRNLKTGSNHTRNIIANNKNDVVSHFTSKGLDVVGIKDIGVSDKNHDERRLQYRDYGDIDDKQDVAEGSTNDYFKRRKDEEDRIAGTKPPAKRTPKQTDYEKKRKQQDVSEGMGSLSEVSSPINSAKIFRFIENNYPSWLEKYGENKVEATVMQMAETGKFEDLDINNAVKLVRRQLDWINVSESTFIDQAWTMAKNKVNEGAKVDRMVKHVKKSEKKLGHSAEEAENIAWATANKRGMLDNKNKKK